MPDPMAPPPKPRVLPPRHPVKMEDPAARSERDRLRQAHIAATVRQPDPGRDASDPRQMNRAELIEAMVSAVTNRVRADAATRGTEAIREALLSHLGMTAEDADDGQQELGLEAPEIPAAEAAEAETGPEAPADPETPPTGQESGPLTDPAASPAFTVEGDNLETADALAAGLTDREINADLEALGIEVDPTLSTEARLALRNEGRAKREADAYPHLTEKQEAALDLDGDGKPGGSLPRTRAPKDPGKAALAKLAKGKRPAPKE